jgi:hypothetical protein
MYKWCSFNRHLCKKMCKMSGLEEGLRSFTVFFSFLETCHSGCDLSFTYKAPTGRKLDSLRPAYIRPRQAGPTTQRLGIVLDVAFRPGDPGYQLSTLMLKSTVPALCTIMLNRTSSIVTDNLLFKSVHPQLYIRQY